MPLRKAAEGKASHPHVRLGSDPSASPRLTRSGSWHSRTIGCCEATCSARKVKKPKHPYERNHQGKGNVRLFPSAGHGHKGEGLVQYRERLGGLLKYYDRDAA